MSLSENLYNLGALMKTNLEEKGIDGLTGNEGLTTLANKIRDITCKTEEENALILAVKGDEITLGLNQLVWEDDIIIDWGDETTTTKSYPNNPITHEYSDGIEEHTIRVIGALTQIGYHAFYMDTNLTNIIIPSSVIEMGMNCFYSCSNLKKVVIPSSVTSMDECFLVCSNLVDYQLFWESSPIPYNSRNMPNNTDTAFTIPVGTTQLYIDAGYPSTKLKERHEYELYVTKDKKIIQTNEDVTLIGMLIKDGEAAVGETLTYQVLHNGSIVDSGSDVTDGNGLAEIIYTGTGTGDVKIIVKHNTLQETYEVYDCIVVENELTQDKTWHIPLDDMDFAMEFIVHPQSNASIGRIIIQETSTKYMVIGDLYSNASCGVQWTNGSFYGKAIPMDTDTKISLKRIGTNMTLTVGETTYNITNMPLTCNALEKVQISSNIIKNFIIYPISTYNLTLSSDKDILSAHDGESATITTLLTEGNTPIEGIELEYNIKHDNIVIDSGTIITDSNGEGNIVYTATGVGDVSVEVAYGTLLQETYELEDCHIYDSGLTDKSSNYVKSTGMSMTHSTDHYILSNTTENSFVNFIDGLDNVLFECDWSAQSDTYMNGICCSDRQTELYNFGGLMRGDNWSISVKFDNGSYHNMNEESSTTDKNKYEKLQMKIEGNNIIHTVFNENGTVIYTYSYSKAISNKYLSAFFSNANSSAYVKNIKVKAL